MGSTQVLAELPEASESLTKTFENIESLAADTQARQVDGADTEELERLAQAAHVLRTFGSTYLLEFSYDDVSVPTFYFARKDEEAACVGVLVGKTRRLDLHSTLYGDFKNSGDDFDVCEDCGGCF